MALPMVCYRFGQMEIHISPSPRISLEKAGVPFPETKKLFFFCGGTRWVCEVAMMGKLCIATQWMFQWFSPCKAQTPSHLRNLRYVRSLTINKPTITVKPCFRIFTISISDNLFFNHQRMATFHVFLFYAHIIRTTRSHLLSSSQPSTKHNNKTHISPDFIPSPDVIHQFWGKSPESFGIQETVVVPNATVEAGVPWSSLTVPTRPWLEPPRVVVGSGDSYTELTFWRSQNGDLVQIWLVVSTHLKNISQNGNLPQLGDENIFFLKPPRFFPFWCWLCFRFQLLSAFQGCTVYMSSFCPLT